MREYIDGVSGNLINFNNRQPPACHKEYGAKNRQEKSLSTNVTFCYVMDMRAVVQRVSQASVSVEGHVKGSIDQGLLVFLGVQESDTEDVIEWLVNKITRLRVFDDEEGKMNRSVMDIEGGILLISQFTLFGNLKKGTRPSFNRAAPPALAIPLYEQVIAQLSEAIQKPVPSGEFGAMMEIDAKNDGPVTLIIDTNQRDF